MHFENIGLKVPKILMPKKGIDLQKWAVVACDQYTSQPDYWEKIKNFVDDSPSSLNLVFPEVYLDQGNDETIISKINENMKKYLESDYLEEQEPAFILVDRKTSQKESRKGLVVALDLEKYDFSQGSQTLIRATEKTIVERLPPRIKIREKASIELPHIMVLIDDPNKTVIEPLFEKNLETVYDFELMQESGHLKGYKVSGALLNETAEKISALAQKDVFESKYGVQDKGVLLFAMGDGNHSLATAKQIWENLKQNADDKQEIMKHPSRFALVELVNVHDDGLEFEPIHRVMFNLDFEKMQEEMKAYYSAQGSECSIEFGVADCPQPKENQHAIEFYTEKGKGIICVKNPKKNLEVGTLQIFLDQYLENHSESKIDYVHGKDIVIELGSKPENAGFLLPSMSKYELFKTVILDGALPRKTFSMGEADEKRFYLESRKIVR